MKDQATIRMLQQQISELQEQVKTLQNAPSLRNASIEDTGVRIKDRDGNVHNVLGKQSDGTFNIAGRLHAGISPGVGIALDYGTKTRRRGFTDQGDPADVWTISTPYVNFHTDRKYEPDQEPSIYIDEGDDQGHDGMMIINPGYPEGTPLYRGKVNVVGDVRANRFEARAGITTPTSIRVGPASTQPGGIFADGLRTRHQGRMPDDQGPHDTIIYGTSTTRQMEPDNAVRGQITFDNPTPTGVRRCTVSAHVANTSWGYDNNRGATASSAAASASSMRYTLQPARNNTGTVEAWAYFAGYWV